MLGMARLSNLDTRFDVDIYPQSQMEVETSSSGRFTTQENMMGEHNIASTKTSRKTFTRPRKPKPAYVDALIYGNTTPNTIRNSTTGHGLSIDVEIDVEPNSIPSQPSTSEPGYRLQKRLSPVSKNKAGSLSSKEYENHGHYGRRKRRCHQRSESVSNDEVGTVREEATKRGDKC
eukprot:CAMPEP_0175070836 /NCGR_PEP_ID=MMETSP0052_2-20121109/18924_1 /TAXON_ID=51329 ORGANISM="Polytomella parva, Strain SAG 63-3" /NCGR_SAMPLE_ID=MMETSP0052_2 /ASSEMBLY_ACC=CAM_ASM_000194 /LENGTH=174 /DNA_ID=CAMNT_0016337971 /DNA_START=1216 /DNA_END=1737 /DNA_ORIENTATION=+